MKSTAYEQWCLETGTLGKKEEQNQNGTSEDEAKYEWLYIQRLKKGQETSVQDT